MFDKKITIPESGYSIATLVFPKLEKGTTKLNFGEDKMTYHFGVSLTDSLVRRRGFKNAPAKILQWIDEEVDRAKITQLREANAPFFQTDSIKIVGFIEGYDPRAGFSSGIIYHADVHSGKDLLHNAIIY